MAILTMFLMSVEDALLSIWQRNIPMKKRARNLRLLGMWHGWAKINSTLNKLAIKVKEEEDHWGDTPYFLRNKIAA